MCQTRQNKTNKGNTKRGISLGLKIWPGDLDLWLWKSIGFQILLRTKYVPSLVKIHWRMLILECSQECYGRTDGSVTISLHNFVGEGITKNEDALYVLCKKFTKKNVRNSPLKNISLDYVRFNNPDLYLIVRTIVLRF